MESPLILIIHKGLSSGSSGSNDRIEIINDIMKKLYNNQIISIIPSQNFHGIFEFYVGSCPDLNRINEAKNIIIRKNDDKYILIMNGPSLDIKLEFNPFEMQDIIIGMVNREIEFVYFLTP